MTVGGLGLYSPLFEGFVVNNNPTPNIQHAGWMDVVTGKSDGYQRDVIDGLLHSYAESGAYGTSWASVASSLPASPALGRTVLRINTDEANDERLYIYNSETSSWKFFDTVVGDYLPIADIDDVPVDGVDNAPISSNWAFDHQNNPTDINHLTDAQVTALHNTYTDAEVETVISAKLVDGQSIDNAIDSLILTHKNITTAHHTKYTNLEATTAMNAIRKVTPYMIIPALDASISVISSASPMYGGVLLPASDEDARCVYFFVLPDGFSSSVTIHVVWTNSTVNSYTYTAETGYDNYDANVNEVMESANPPNASAMSFVADTQDWEVKEETRNITSITKEFLAIHVGSTASNSSYIVIKAVYLTET